MVGWTYVVGRTYGVERVRGFRGGTRDPDDSSVDSVVKVTRGLSVQSPSVGFESKRDLENVDKSVVCNLGEKYQDRDGCTLVVTQDH